MFPMFFFAFPVFFSVFNSEDAAVEINGDVINNAQVVREVEINKENLRRQFGEGFDMNNRTNVWAESASTATV